MQETEHQTSFNPNVLLLVTVISSFFNPMLGAAVNIALPRIGDELAIPAVQLSWINMSFLLSSAVFLVPLGKLGDMWGRKKMFLWGNVFLAFSSVFCALASSVEILILGRLLQGISSAMMVTTSMAMVIAAFPLNQRGKVIGLNVAAVYIGLSASPLLGGVITQSLGWRALFFISIGVALAIVLLVIWKIKTDWVESTHEPFDLRGTLIYMPSMTLMMYGLSGMPELKAVLCFCTGLLGLIVFVKVELKEKFPVLNMQLFVQNKAYAGSNLSAFIFYAATFAVGFMLSIYLQRVMYLSPSESGMLLMTQPILMAVVAVISGRLSDKLNPRIMASVGMSISVVGLFMLGFLAEDTSSAYLITALAILGFGFGLFSSPNTNIIMSSVEKRFIGVASATVGTMRNTGMMFSMAIATLAIHVFVGNKLIEGSNKVSFVESTHVVFLIFAGLCIAGVFLSLLRGKKS